jgi:hypothetical protein
MKQVTITTREVYHKVASVTIDVPSDISEDKIHEWLLDNHELFAEQLDNNISKSEFDFGFGLQDGMDWIDSESETRFDLIEDNKKVFGGHL